MSEEKQSTLARTTQQTRIMPSSREQAVTNFRMGISDNFKDSKL